MGIIVLAIAAVALVVGLELNQRRNRRGLPIAPQHFTVAVPQDRDLERLRDELLTR
ncbi:hypothetical protein [Streptacidiphilus rugosus]|uniref:hypothetical protein n=1 Tax=Streptacidiphilus rugosus TaxID=405783 RepID=UPI000AD0BD71|nr:hypothetical protein [Streptacidiphilus rugosus]